LLEAVVALALLSGLIVVTLNIRAANLAASRRISSRLAAADAADETLRMALAGALFELTSQSDKAVNRAQGASADGAADTAQVERWEGVTAGVSCLCTRQRVSIKNPLPLSEEERKALSAQDRKSRRSLQGVRVVALCDGEEASVLLPAQ